jgi:uncharacterized protein
MSTFTLTCYHQELKKDVQFTYDNQTSELRTQDGSLVLVPEKRGTQDGTQVFGISKVAPGSKSTMPRVVKIQMGLSCNYSCEYCSQRFVPHADETELSFVNTFVESLKVWFKPPEGGLGRKIEFWGGEPFVYAKTFKPLAEALRGAYPNIQFSVITNGSLLTKEWIDWLYDLGFNIAISHDGPGQEVRGPDPIGREKTREVWLYAYQKLKGRMSFNSMLNRINTSRVAIANFFREFTGDIDVPLGEGGFVDAYDEGGTSMSLRPEEYQSFANQCFAEMHSSDIARNFSVMQIRINNWLNSWRSLRPASVLGQKCGMDMPDQIAVDLRGNVLTCQNVSAVAQAPNGESHKLGSMMDMENVRLTTSTHWSNRECCQKCPVVQVCAGACMFLEGDLWESSCNNAFFDHIAFFAEALYLVTGCILKHIEGDIPVERKDPFGIAQPALT